MQLKEACTWWIFIDSTNIKVNILRMFFFFLIGHSENVSKHAIAEESNMLCQVSHYWLQAHSMPIIIVCCCPQLFITNITNNFTRQTANRRIQNQATVQFSSSSRKDTGVVRSSKKYVIFFWLFFFHFFIYINKSFYEKFMTNISVFIFPWDIVYGIKFK